MTLSFFALLFSLVLSTLTFTSFCNAAEGEQKNSELPYGVIDQTILSFAYVGSENFLYKIAYTGGIKLGELHLEVRKVAGAKDAFELYTLVSTEGSIFNTIYPVRDIHITQVVGKDRYPFSYEVWQKEGYNYQAHKLTKYHQEDGKISYRRNDGEAMVYEVVTPVHNEFSSFFASRVMAFGVGSSFIVPTFADKKRAEVEVQVLEKVHFKDTVLGPVDTLKISPILTFKGLYDKRGDTTIWYTDDNCRVPVKITSKLAIGSITATLLSYENPACSYNTGKQGK